MSKTLKTTVDNAVVEYMRVNNLTAKETKQSRQSLPTEMTVDSVRADIGDQDIDAEYFPKRND